MNKKALSFATIGVALMIGIALIVLAMGVAPAIKQGVDTARDSNNLDCSNESISVFDKTACITADSSQFLFIGGLIFLAFAVIAGARRLY